MNLPSWVPKDPDNWTVGHWEKAVNMALKAFDYYEKYNGDPYGKEGTRRFGEYLYRKEVVEAMANQFYEGGKILKALP